MPHREIGKYLYDVSSACDLIAVFVDGKTFDDYRRDPMLRSAVERQFEIIGEALNGAVKIDADIKKQIPDAPRIISFRNRLIHGYATVSDAIVWGIVENYLPPLREQVKRMLDELPPETL
jgi:uncharacterized protein with HEPN domain